MSPYTSQWRFIGCTSVTSFTHFRACYNSNTKGVKTLHKKETGLSWQKGEIPCECALVVKTFKNSTAE